MATHGLRFIGVAGLLISAAGCGGNSDKAGGGNDKGGDAASSFHLAAHGFGPINSSQDACLKLLREIAKDGKPADAKAFKKHVEDFEKAVAERKGRLGRMDPRPEGKSVQPLLDGCVTHVELQEKVWLPTFKDLLATMEKRDDEALRDAIREVMPKCQKAERESRKELEGKFADYEKEFGVKSRE